ncbi:enoyl-CoA hydratase/isomerase [Nitzschia inconspicua]|uniref:Enoyl-CoA hydratase/isomerase n=1 Tax=Nitzschia inconspicua TaxID=303405 RepID=A0A9K3LTF6_9STRA|nr:enoyl-CoA hydratase/isomerase [Nitzschia inconspicua]
MPKGHTCISKIFRPLGGRQSRWQQAFGDPNTRRRTFASTPSSSSLVSWSVQDKVGTIELHSQKTFNALTVEMGKEFRSLIHQLEPEFHESSNIQAVVLCGEGDQAFSAGGNLEWLQSLHNNSVHANVDWMLQFYTSFLCLRQKIPVPVIAALTGPAMGAGACLAMACDLRVACDDADRPVLGFPFSKLGIPSGMGGLYLLQHSGLTTAQANEILMLGKSLTGPEAFRLGLVNRTVPKDEVKNEAMALAKEIATKHPVAVRSMIRNCRLEQDRGLMDALHRDAYAQAMCYAREDWGRGLQVVAQKREADFDDYHSK